MIPRPQSKIVNNAFVDVVSDARAHELRFILWPYYWQKCQVKVNLNWQVYEFNDRSIISIPSDPGVYAFLIQPRLACDLNASYLVYIGKTDRPLRQRYQEYLQETINPTGRPRIVETLIRYSGYIFFSCSPIFNQKVTPAEVEEELLRAFLPPKNSEFPAEVRRIIAAF
jgi:hypothetical protein